jgi:hypothetical protein
MKKGKRIIVLAKPIKPKKIAAAMACCKQGPARYQTGDD